MSYDKQVDDIVTELQGRLDQYRTLALNYEARIARAREILEKIPYPVKWTKAVSVEEMVKAALAALEGKEEGTDEKP